MQNPQYRPGGHFSISTEFRTSSHLFQGRYKAILVERDSYLLGVCRYVVLNPVRAGMVECPEQWGWSSYKGTAGLRKAHPCLTSDWILGQLSERKAVAWKKYKQFVLEGIDKKSIWRKVKGQALLGDEGFIERLRQYLKKREKVKEVPKSQRFVGRPGLDRLLIGRAVLNKGRRDRKIVEAVVRYGYSQKEVSDYLGMHYSTISKILNALETGLNSKTKT
ncbi:helix-turn-helix domain-containing protein [bacterium AH-315-L15]|nr:helix-turn-helix domain-containing protein [bacterium AH-315-L15]